MGRKPRPARKLPGAGRRDGGRVSAAAEPRSSRDLAFLLQASEELARSLELGDVLSIISRNLLEVVPAWRVGVLLREGDDLRLAAGFVRGGAGPELPRGRVLDPRRYPEVAEAIASRRSVLVEDVATSDLMEPVRGPI